MGGVYIAHQKERFNVAYVGALTAQAGVNINSPVVDNDWPRSPIRIRCYGDLTSCALSTKILASAHV